MNKLTVVSNSGPLISLSAIGQLNLLKSLFGTICIPEAVYREVVLLGQNKPGQAEVQQASWITQACIHNVKMAQLMLDTLDAGESECLVLALERNADYVILDERLGRRRASRLGIPVIGTLGILLMAKDCGYIQHIAQFLTALEKTSFRISHAVKFRMLSQAGEEDF